MLIFTISVAVVLVVSFLCSIFESVLLSINHAQIESLEQRGKSAGRLFRRFKRNIDIPIAAILILNTAAHTVGASVAGASYINVFGPATLWIFTIIFTLAVLLLTEIIPKTLGVAYTNILAIPAARGILLLTIVFRPLVYISESISRRLRGHKEQPATSVEEIRLLAALGRNEGLVGPGTANMILGATRLRQMTAANVMIPRQEVSFLSRKDTRQDVVEKLKTLRFSRFPFTDSQELDDVSGIVLAKKLLFWLQEHPEGNLDWDTLVTDVQIVPESKPLNLLLRMFQDSQRHLAIVIDEYGGVEGIVTLEDVVEEIVGEIIDESDAPLDDLQAIDDGSLIVGATVDMRRVCASLGIEWIPQPKFATIGGLLIEELSRMPVKGDAVYWRGHRLEVLSAGRRGSKRIRIVPHTDEDAHTIETL